MSNPRAFYQVLRLYSAVSEQLEDCLRPENITASQYTVLSLLGSLEPSSSADLARRLGITAQSMGQLVQALEAKGLVQRDLSPTHGRRIDIRRTPKGRKALANCDRLVDRAEQVFFGTLSADEQASFKRVMARLRMAHHAAEGSTPEGSTPKTAPPETARPVRAARQARGA